MAHTESRGNPQMGGIKSVRYPDPSLKISFTTNRSPVNENPCFFDNRFSKMGVLNDEIGQPLCPQSFSNGDSFRYRIRRASQRFRLGERQDVVK